MSEQNGFLKKKMDGKFNRKSRLVAGGQKKAPPSSTIYSIVVTRESLRLAFIIYGLNDLDICACDIGNAYLNLSFFLHCFWLLLIY